MIQPMTGAIVAPEWVLGILFILEVITGIFLERKRRKISRPGVNSSHLQCTEHTCLVEKLDKIDKKLDQMEITDRLDKISSLLVDLKGAKI